MRSGNGNAPNIDIDVVKGLSQPSALYDELVRYILSTVGCKLQNESTLRLVSHAAQISLEKLFEEAKSVQVSKRLSRGDHEAKPALLKEDVKELEFPAVCETLQKTDPNVHNYNIFLEPNENI
ncbi:uncharacterized protein TOT_010000259 [Theileria orientalis strain Shintoku]|uniref:Uncharacterized protein n=1 Tax=Theileria orientalis strain Shintoku TaxID=869250 RepID=J7MGV2_THEOR|nr:uncharacterized protein TOT_010000259 [Theileria orientalis strain Shintoku]PVC52285.1 hypothetical protein MACL_00000889 [Theileria orientalis]BAM38791.1 uncharacterized protein TOT_010000259 [Theileria orientalis strain Shintoku]|eukprot:XP_009689092.1 uncharacterized protein TOT_010000259 [Theileria orientalis strain Shintoku]